MKRVGEVIGFGILTWDVKIAVDSMDLVGDFGVRSFVINTVTRAECWEIDDEDCGDE